ncbi:hypothetical protein RSOLAG22IIIB_11006 [Rhizoctonia solani]|uniref:Lysine-specific metallo-endopeptidase domain-containing protein n=1 Tax=Rhizoctonia solani TaxID=456999 RepID=A0A0K6G6C0_9AGAM|nr:hypothetical protein RSOLAG22IIIB_11006 [Rhizoctonia solani]
MKVMTAVWTLLSLVYCGLAEASTTPDYLGSNRSKTGGELSRTKDHRSILVARAPSRVKFVGCNDQEKEAIRLAKQKAGRKIESALKHFKTYPNYGAQRYERWFGLFTKHRHDVVRSHFVSMDAHLPSVVYDCGTCLVYPGDTYETTVAYLAATTPTNSIIDLCGRFWKIPISGAGLSQSGVILRELLRVENIAGTLDGEGGLSAALSLAEEDPDRAVLNADNYLFL